MGNTLTDNLYQTLNEIKDLDVFKKAAGKYNTDMTRAGYNPNFVKVALDLYCPKCDSYTMTAIISTGGTGVVFNEPAKCKECGTKVYIDCFIGTRVEQERTCIECDKVGGWTKKKFWREIEENEYVCDKCYDDYQDFLSNYGE